MKITRQILACAGATFAVASCGQPAMAQASSPTTTQTLASEISQYVSVPFCYEPGPKAFGVLGRVRIGNYPRIGADFDTLAGMSSPLTQIVLGKHIANLSGQIGLGLSWSWTAPKTSYYARLGFGGLAPAGGQPFGTVYFMVGAH